MRKWLFLGALLGLLQGAQAQTDSGVQITFLPPPMEGTLSLGIYARDGKLVRVLRSEASVEKDFTAGLNGLITTWDGKDDAGKPAPAGTYAVHGYCVGAMQVSGEAFHGNDWITDDESPRVAEISSLKALSAGRLQVRAQLVDGSSFSLRSDAEGKFSQGADDEPDRPESGGGVENLLKGPIGALPNLEKPRDACLGVDGSIWVIDEAASGVEVKQYSAKKEFVRRLAIGGHDPAPRQIAASTTEERIFLLEVAPGWQRVRGLSLQTTTPAEGGPATSTWETFFTKSIRTTESFAAIAPLLQRPEFKAEEKLRLRLLPNPLYKDAPGSVDLQIAFDARGSYLRASDGLPLSRLTETTHLRWTAFGHEGKSKSVTVFQSDGAVVEEFRIRQTANMMAFDAGDYELKR